MTTSPGGLVGRRLKVLSVVAPAVFVAVLEVVRLALENSPGWSSGVLHTWRVVLLGGFIACIAAFAFVMLRLIERAEAAVVRQNHELHRRRDEGHAFYGVLLAISRQSDTLPTLTSIAGQVRDLLAADAAAVLVPDATAHRVRSEADADAPLTCHDGTAVLGVGLPDGVDAGETLDPVGDLPWGATAACDVAGPAGVLGTLWVGRRDERPFTDRDRSFLTTMASLAGIALTSAQVREDARQHEVLKERTRIAREMHDGLAQVLGAVHLRLRTLQTAPELPVHTPAAAEVGALADVCEDAYHDVREVILGLRHSAVADRGLLENLRSYLEKYSAQSGIATELVDEVGGEMALAPRTEVQLIRVAQEALTNVRKHAQATRATVTVTGTATTTSLTIADDGRGFKADPRAALEDGYGLFTMRDRVALLGGRLTVTSTPGRGTQVVATVPERARCADGVRSTP